MWRPDVTKGGWIAKYGNWIRVCLETVEDRKGEGNTGVGGGRRKCISQIAMRGDERGSS